MPGSLIRLTVVATVVMVGAGACAFGPRREEADAVGLQPVSAAGASSGASASPGPGQTAPRRAAPTPTASGSAQSASEAPATTAKKPARSTGTGGPARPAAAKAGCPQGENQRQVEQYLARLGGFGPVTVDGRQSTADCRAIKKFQQRYGISPAAGRAGPTTADVARRLADTRTDRCRVGSGTTICVNLTLQTVWVMRAGKVVMKPTVTRTGKSGYRTPAGTFAINRRNIKEWSDPYKVWLPYWQHFTRGMGFHETTTYLHNSAIGSHGCVNLLPTDARRLWQLGRMGTRVYLFGRRPGT